MNARAAHFLAFGSALAAGWAVLTVQLASAQPPSQTTATISAAEKNAPYPTFASVPPAPKDVRPLSAWKTAITDIHASGKSLAELAAAQPWTLSDTDGFAAQARVAGTPPAQVTFAADPATGAMVAEMRARAKAPPRSR